MKSTVYILSMAIAASILFTSHMPLIEDATNQRASFGFFETYTWTEILSDLDPADRFFQWVNTEGESKNGCRLGSCTEANSSELWDHIHSSKFRKQLPEDIRFAWGANKEKEVLVLYALKEHGSEQEYPNISHIQDVSAKKSTWNDSYELLISFNEEGAKLWAGLTGANVDKDLAIVFNDKVYSAPNVREAIKGGKCSISGNLDEDDVNLIKSILEE